MKEDSLWRLRMAVQNIPDFPRPGIVFRDITPILKNKHLFREAVHAMASVCDQQHITQIAAVEARGFIFGAAIASALNIGFIPLRKKGKLPPPTRSTRYLLEYGSAEIECREGVFEPKEKVCLVDDILATGGTAKAAVQLIQECGGEVTLVQCFIELKELSGRAVLTPLPIHALLVF